MSKGEMGLNPSCPVVSCLLTVSVLSGLVQTVLSMLRFIIFPFFFSMKCYSVLHQEAIFSPFDDKKKALEEVMTSHMCTLSAESC